MDGNDAELEPGQIWTYRTRAGEEASRLTIDVVGAVDGLGEVVHGRLDGLRVANPLRPDGINTELPHFPITGEALRPCLVELIGYRDGQPDLSGYDEWRAAEGGYFTVPLAEIPRLIEDALGHGRPEE